MPFAVAAGVGLVIAAGFSLATGPSRLDAAIALDRVFHLNERVSTALTLPADLRSTPAGEALVADAIRKVADLDVGAEFGLRMPRRAWVVLIPATISAMLLFAPSFIPRLAQARAAAEVDSKALVKQTDLLTKKIASQREAIDKQKFPEAEKILAQIEKKTEELSKAPPAGKDKLMVELNTSLTPSRSVRSSLARPSKLIASSSSSRIWAPRGRPTNS